MRKRYIVSTRFFSNYFKDFLEENKIKYEVSWTEAEMTNKIVTTEIDEEQEKAIMQFLKFPVKKQKEVEENDK